MNAATPSVELLYITWNRLAYTEVTLPIVLNQGGDVDYRVQIVDNGSTDGTVEYLKALDHPRVSRVILNSQNLGISPVTNAFWAQSTADYLGKVDNDIFLPDRWLEPIMRVHNAKDPHVGVVGLTHFKPSEIDEVGHDIEHNVKTLANGVQVFVQNHIGGACYAFPRGLYETFGSVALRHDDLRWGWAAKQREFYAGGSFPCYVYPWITCVHMGDPTRPDLPNIDPTDSVEEMAERKRRHQTLLLAPEPGRDWDARYHQPVAPVTRAYPHEQEPREGGTPLVSVVLTSHNYARYLPTAIESVMAQTYREFELIVVDDGSTDESPRIIEDYARLYPSKIHAITRTENWGLSRSYNQALEHVSGTVYADISSDDVWASDAIEKWVRFFASNPDVDVLATDFDVIGPDGAIHTGEAKLEIVPQFNKFFEIDFDTLYTSLLRGNFLPDPAIVVSLRRVKKSDLRYDERCPLLSDWELYLRLAKKFRWAYLAEPTVLYRWHGENLSSPDKLERRADVLGQRMYVLGKELASSLAMQDRAIIVEQIGRVWSDYTAMLGDAGFADTASLPGGVSASEVDHLRERAEHLEEERDRQQARAEALDRRTAQLEEERRKQHERAEALEDQARSLAERIVQLERANPLARARRRMATTRRRLSNGRFDHEGMFDPDWYLQEYPDVKASGVEPFEHYVRFGAAEGRDPSPAFDTDYYVSRYPDVAAAGLNPLAHFLKFGRQEGRDPRRPNESSD